MRELNMAWRLLKNVSSSDDYGDVSTALDDEERMKVEAIKRKNAEHHGFKRAHTKTQSKYKLCRR